MNTGVHRTADLPRGLSSARFPLSRVMRALALGLAMAGSAGWVASAQAAPVGPILSGGGAGGVGSGLGAGEGGAGGLGGGGGGGGWGGGGSGDGGNGGAGATLAPAQAGERGQDNPPLIGGAGGLAGGPDLSAGGGGGGSAASTHNGVTGGSGGSGRVDDSTSVTLTGDVAGIPGDFLGAGGGGGGAGLVLTGSNATLTTNGAQISGGQGGDGTIHSGSGGGGAGVVLANSGTINASAGTSIQGGAAGISYILGGGQGGAGVFLYQGGQLNNAGTVTGGGSVGIDTGSQSNAAVLMNGGGVLNTGSLTGGSGGTGGAGVVGSNISIINGSGGTITGGLASGGTARADAIVFTGGSNTLKLMAGSAIVGNVDATAGTNTLILGGDAGTPGSFDVSTLGSGQQYDGFSSYVKADAGTWDLTGTTQAVTPWTLQQGVLAAQSDASLGDASGVLTFDGGTLQAADGFTSTRSIVLGAGGGTVISGTDSSGAGTVALNGQISGTGGLTTQGYSVLTLGGVNTYTGGTTVGSRVTVTATGALGSGPVTVDSGLGNSSFAELDFNGSSSAQGLQIQNIRGGGTLFHDSSSAGSATITNNGGGTAFDGSSSAGSATIVNDGGGAFLTTLTAFSGSSNAGNARIVNRAEGITILSGPDASLGTAHITNEAGGHVFFAGGSAGGATVVNHAGGDVDLSLSSFSGFTGGVVIGSLSGAGSVHLGSTSLTLVLGSLNQDDVIDGVLSDGGLFGGAGGSLAKVGTGTLTLNGVNTYTGSTTVSAGTLMVGDANHASATVPGSVQVDAAGTLRGHGLVVGNVTSDGIVWPGGSIGTLTVGGDYTQAPTGTLMVDVSPTGASQLKVGGTANLAGSLALLYGPGTYTAKSYPILTAGSVKGTFATVSGSALPAGFTQTVSYAPGVVDLNLLGAPLVVAPANATIFGGLGAALLRSSQHANGLLLGRLEGGCTSASEAGCTRPGQRLWIQTEGTLTHVDGNRGAPDVHDQRYGFMVGADRTFGPWTAGVAGGYSHSDLWESGDRASGKVDTARLALYGGRSLGAVRLSGTASYAYHFTSTQRDFPGFGQTKGDGHGQEFATALQASVPLALGSGLTLAPHLGLRYAYVDGLSEDESGLASQQLNARGQTLQSLQPYAGATLNYAFTPSGTERPGHVQLRAGYAYETQSVDRDVTVVARDGTGFVVPGSRDSRNQVTAGLGLDLPLGKATRIYARYDAVLPTGNVMAQSAQVGVNYRF